MTDDEVFQIFRETKALLNGHFELRSKLHSNCYFQCAEVLRWPHHAQTLCTELVRRMKEETDIGTVTGVISPALGGILVGHEVAKALETQCIFAEKNAEGKLLMRRFKINPGERYVVAEDVITRGGRVQETIDIVEAAGAEVAAVLVLVDRSGGAAKFAYPTFALLHITPEVWTAETCPMCKANEPFCHPGS
ncbi:MAG: orotate phosphoribosyltransferase [Kiritimatiellia bacterium]